MDFNSREFSMFFRQKQSGKNTYLQIVESKWENGRSKQNVIVTCGRLDVLQKTGKLDSLLRSGLRFSEKLAVLDAHRKGETSPVQTTRIGPDLVFGKLWKQLAIADVINSMLQDRKYEFPVERAIYVTVLHRLFDPGSDRAAEKWYKNYAIEKTQGLELHHFYRAMGWIGEPLSKKEQDGATPFSPRCQKDKIEEQLFSRRRDLFSKFDLVFFDTTSIYFEGEGGETLGKRGNSKDHRPDLKQMVVGIILDNEGNPVCSEFWPGNTTDVNTLVPIVKRLEKRFGIHRICIVADRGMISAKTLEEIQKQGWQYILGARMRKQKEVKQDVLVRAGRYQEVYPKSKDKKVPSPLKVKEVFVGDNRYVVCHNEDQAHKDRKDREAIIESLQEALKRGDKSLVGNKGYRKFLKTRETTFEIDYKKCREEARYDGKWVLRTNTGLSSKEVALKYKELWMVEAIFRSMKSLLQTRPIYHKCDETIRGHVFCSFLALLLRKEVQDQLGKRNWRDIEWNDVIHDLEELQEIETVFSNKSFVLRSETKGVAGKVIQAVGATLPQTIRQKE